MQIMGKQTKASPTHRQTAAAPAIPPTLLYRWLTAPWTRRPLSYALVCSLVLTGLIFAASLTSNSTANAKSAVPDNLGAINFQALKPTKDQVRTSVNILDQLTYQHYRELEINDQLSSFMLDRYITDLDPSKIYFLANDVHEFEQFRLVLDDALKSGNLKPGFTIYNRYQSRVIERLTYVIRFIETEFDTLDFSKKEEIEIDREHASWPARPLEMNELWRKRVKGTALSLLLAEKPLNEIKTLLLKRYRNKLNRALQNKSEDAFQAYINSLTQTFDPHTQYFSPRNSENFNINMSLSLEGIGAVLQTEDEYTKVVRLVPAGPADKSGQLHPADRIVGVAQAGKEMVDVVGWRIDEVVQLIRGPKGTVVKLEIIGSESESNHDTKVIEILRDKVKLEEQAAQKELLKITHGQRTLNVGVIDIPTFYIDFKAQHNRDPNYRSTTRDVSRLIRELQRESMDGLIIDLRNNGGGSLQEANTLLGLFIKAGPTVQVRDDRGRVEMIQDDNLSILYKGPLVVLVNRLSASASEIFAGAIQDYQRGLVIGSQTFGKGTVQALRNLNRGQLKITQAKFYRISGESNQHQGIIPDILYPSFYDESEIGESTLENALPWDRIRAARFTPYQQIQPIIPALKVRHESRIQHDPDFQHLVAQIGLSQELKKKTMLSLNQGTRVEERKEREAQRLALENTRRKAKGLALLDKLDDDSLKGLSGSGKSSSTKSQDANKDRGKDKEDGQSKDELPDALLNETANIVADMVVLSKKKSLAAH